MSLQNHEISALPGQVISDCQARLPAADHHRIESPLTAGNVHRHSPLIRFSSDIQVGEHLSIASVPGASVQHIGRITWKRYLLLRYRPEKKKENSIGMLYFY